MKDPEDQAIFEANEISEIDLMVEIDEERLAPYNEIDTDDHQRDSDLEYMHESH